MKWLLIGVLLLCACERGTEEGEEELERIEPGRIDAVLDDILTRMETHLEEEGARITRALPEIKEEAARAAGFESFNRFLAGVRTTEPGREVDISRKITAHLRELTRAEAPEEE